MLTTKAYQRPDGVSLHISPASPFAALILVLSPTNSALMDAARQGDENYFNAATSNVPDDEVAFYYFVAGSAKIHRNKRRFTARKLKRPVMALFTG